MPIYEYACEKCNLIIEHIAFTDKSEIACKNCGDVAKRIISRSTFRLIGPGFHATDYGTNVLRDADD